ncbi:hypothetical protein B0A55_02800 [Friedmanniomyces simplex]|uniref:Uncharacterized protein n=1 Tax=Friedmanniomyces simplex TaxID=329884 RepID=A0A4U0XTM5_9PEZI|nr:hypothetical protein B0A55_02800 [Friedmanniomyces simplex]
MATIKLALEDVGFSVPLNMTFTFHHTTKNNSHKNDTLEPAPARVFNDLIIVNLAYSSLNEITAYLMQRFDKHALKLKNKQADVQDFYQITGMCIKLGRCGGKAGLCEENWEEIKEHFTMMLFEEESTMSETADIEVECYLEG